MQRYVRNRATNLESFFRRSHARPNQRFIVPAGSESDAKRQLARNNLWAFWKLDQYIKNQLFFSHKRLTQRGGQPRQQQSGCMYVSPQVEIDIVRSRIIGDST